MTITGTHLADATRVTFNGKLASVITDSATKINTDVPTGATSGYIKVTTPGGVAKSTSKFNVLLADSSTATTPASATILIGSDNTDSAVVSGDATSGRPTGTVAFYDCGPTTSAEPCTSKENPLGSPVGVTAGANDTSTARSGLFTPTSTGNWCFAGYYSGDNNYETSADTSTDECFDVRSGTTPSSTTTTPASVNVAIGESDSDRAVTTGDATYGSPTGTVAFYECGPTTTAEPCTSTADPVGSPVDVSPGSNNTSTSASVSFTPTSTGYWCFAGYYSGDNNYEMSSDTSTDECLDANFDVVSVATSDDGAGYCGLLTSSGVACWDNNSPVPVEGVGGVGELTGVKSVVGSGTNGHGFSYCALLTAGGVDCWGDGTYGSLGNGSFSDSTVPVVVVGVGGTGTLAGVTDLIGNSGSYCAVLTTDGVDCWGYGYYGDLGDGTFYDTGNEGSATPVEVVGVGGTGTLSGVSSLLGSPDAFCAVLATGGVDCWGYNYYGQLGDGAPDTTGNEGSATPVQVKGVGATGTLTGVASLTSNGDDNYCALLKTNGVDCWGYGTTGQLGDGAFVNEAVPVSVVGIGDTGTLTGVASLASSGDGYCAVLTSTEVDCWGYGYYGELGGGMFEASDVPVAVVGVGGSGTLTGVASLVGGGENYCALLTTGAVDCWGIGADGQLGDGTYYTTGNEGSATPEQVVGVGGTGTLTGVASLVSDVDGYCAVSASGNEVDCWGQSGLGDGSTQSATPVSVS